MQPLGLSAAFLLGLSLASCAQSQQPCADIRTIDLPNTTIRTLPPLQDANRSTGMGAPGGARTIRFKNGTFLFQNGTLQWQARLNSDVIVEPEPGTFVRLVSISVGNLTDGAWDYGLALQCVNGRLRIAFQESAWRGPTWHTTVGGFETHRYLYKQTDSLCCPSLEQTTRYIWDPERHTYQAMEKPKIVRSDLAVPTGPCHQLSLTASIDTTDEYHREFLSGTTLNILPMKDSTGWQITLTPKGRQDDWIVPVTLPLRTGEAATISSGYGQTLQDRLRMLQSAPQSLRFTRSAGDYRHWSKLARLTLTSTDPNSAQMFLKEVQEEPLGRLAVRVRSYSMKPDQKEARSAILELRATVPPGTSGLTAHWHPISCQETP
jgi:hypothetical protein